MWIDFLMKQAEEAGPAASAAATKRPPSSPPSAVPARARANTHTTHPLAHNGHSRAPPPPAPRLPLRTHITTHAIFAQRQIFAEDRSASSDRALLPTAVSRHRSTALTPTAKLPATQRLAAASRQLNAAAPAPALSAGTAGSTTGHGAVMVGESTSGLLAT